MAGGMPPALKFWILAHVPSDIEFRGVFRGRRLAPGSVMTCKRLAVIGTHMSTAMLSYVLSHLRRRHGQLDP